MNWREAEAKVREIAKRHGIEKIFWGTGYPYSKPNVVAWTKDAWSGEGVGYNVLVYPKGEYYGAPCVYYSVPLKA